MYIDENGGADGELKVTVEDEDYTAEATYDLDDDGVNESAVVETDDGGHLAFSDTDDDGVADLMSTYDENGQLVSQAKFDEDDGEWVAVDPSDSGDDRREQRTNTGDDSTIVVTSEDGSKEVGPATEDTDGDGRADTAVVRDDDGDTWLFTDADGDGDADLATEITSEGDVTMSERDGDGWTEVETGHIGSDGKYVPDARSGALDGWGDDETPVTVEGVVRIDSTTGQWISPN
ncbi:hypothetical protein [Umezawaea beigongshangensis]|uniref:hypothetical protein n=1 Tax=Umezawaea beigongshangensis TaxID=2780383 RepID=UPI0018F16F6A|nr:hypothetical protein [Umezawaea beigongshangensis]